MAKSNRIGRKNAGETGETFRNAPKRNVAGEQEDVQNAENVNNVMNAADAPVELDALLGMLAQILVRLPAVAPALMVQPLVVNVQQVVEDEDALHVPRNPSYLKVMDHMQKLGTKFFSGGSNPIEADQLITRLEWNFDFICCPKAYTKDIAVHYLEGDAHTWWQGGAGRMDNQNGVWGLFCEEFRRKYFPPEAFDKLEGAFLDLRQGIMTMREYETEFNSLKK